MNDLVIGIDLGTTNSCAAVYVNGRTTVLENSENQRTTASVVFFNEKNTVTVGNYAKNMALAKPESAVFEIKRLVGRQADDQFVQNNLRFYPFRIDETSKETVVLIEQFGEPIRKTPTDICALILSKIKRDIEAKIGDVQKAVITVPAYFNVKQREATLAAADQAGFTVLKLLNEPTAAALCYYHQKKDSNEEYSLVYDLGGGTFDVAVIKRKRENIEIVSVDGDSHLGGQDFDNMIIDYVWGTLDIKHKFKVRRDRRKLRRLAKLCEEAKKTLSVTDETIIYLDGFVSGEDDLSVTLTRAQFETMADSLFQKTINIVDCCLKSCNLPKTKIQEVILAGGSTRIPKIQSLLTEYFEGKTLNRRINQDECVAEGAALQAAMFSKHPSQKITDIKVTDVTSLSLGISSVGGVMNFFIKRNTPIPVSVTEERSTVYDKQKLIHFKIYEGERLNVQKNRYLGELYIDDLTPAPPRQCCVILTLAIDNNGILTITAKEKHKDNEKDLKVTYTRGNRSDSEVKNTVQDAEDHKEEDEEFLHFVNDKKYLLHYCLGVIYNIENKQLVSVCQDIYDLCKKIKEEAERVRQKDKEKVTKWIDEVNKQCDSVVKKHKFRFIPIRPNH